MKMANWRWRRWPPLVPCLPLLPRLPALHGKTDVGHGGYGMRLTSELVLLFLYVGVIALWHAFDDRRLAGRAAGIPGADWRGESADYSLLR